MKPAYEMFDHVTREILDTVKRGDLVRCNDWKAPLRVAASSVYYFVMSRKAFGKTIYSVCEKIPTSHSRNNYTEGYFRIGTDDRIFGVPGGYDWETEAEARAYLDCFERGKLSLSLRSAVNLVKISIKRSRYLQSVNIQMSDGNTITYKRG